MKYGSVGLAGEEGVLVALSFDSGWAESLGGSICEVSTKQKISRPNSAPCNEAPHANETQSDPQPTRPSTKNQANSMSFSAGSSTSYDTYSCIGDRFSVPGSANCFLPGVDEFVLDESV